MAAIKVKGPVSTSSAAALVVFTTADIGGQKPRHFQIMNEGAEPGFYSFDGGVNFRRVPALSGIQLDGIALQGDDPIQIQRDGGTDMTDIYIGIW